MGRLAMGQAWPTFERLVILETDECVLWPGAITSSGYGNLWTPDGNVRTHVMACQRHHGPAPSTEHLVAHLPKVCHERACMNYRHLRWATRAENETDKVLDGTDCRGERHGAHVLTDAQVLEIRRLRSDEGHSLRRLGAAYGVHHTTILDLTTGTLRAWLNPQPQETSP